MTDIVVQKRSRPEAVIDDDHVAVEPGQIAQTTMRVRNTGTEIAEYEVSPVPDCTPGPWMEAIPPSFRLMPGKEQQVILRFQPPMDTATEAGRFPYGVLIAPDEVEHQAQIVAEGDVSVGAIHALDVRLTPRQSKGRWRGKHMVVMHNRGTDDTRVKLNAVDEEDAVSLALAPTSLTVPARATVEAYLRVRPRAPQIMGKPVDHPFQVTYRRRVDGRTAAMSPTDGGEIEASVQGSFRHKPIISPLVIVLGLVLIGLVVLLLVLRPWETEDPRRPPDPPAGLTASSEGTGVTLGWENAPNVDEILVREVDCTTATDVIPTAAGEETSVIPAGSGRQTHTIEDFALGEIHCFQARAVSADGRSVWAPSPPHVVNIGTDIPQPEIAVTNDGCTLVVDITPVDAEGAQFKVFINGREDSNLVTGGGQQRYPDQEAGQAVKVFVQTAIGEQAGPPSDTEEVQMPADCADDPGDPGDPGDPNGPVVDLRGRTFLLIAPVDVQDATVGTWQSIAAFNVGMDRTPIDGVVGESVLLPDNAAGPLSGRRVIYVDGYPDTPGGEAEARDNCAQLNRIGLDTDPTLGFCRLVAADGTVTNVDPAPDPDETTTTG